MGTIKKKRNNFRRFWKLGMEEWNTTNFDISSNSELMVREGNYQYNLYDIIKKYGTSTEIVFPAIIENRVRDLIDTFDAYIKILNYKGKFFYHYAMKVNQNREFVLPAVSEGANLETASFNELFLVKRMIEQDKFDTKIRVICNGPKTEKYIGLIEELKSKGLIVIPIIESYTELERLQTFKGAVGIRVNLDVKVESHWDKKFNQFGFTETQLLQIGKVKNLTILHYHISSQIEKLDGLLKPFRRSLDIYAEMRKKNPGLDTIDIGGGAGVPYSKNKRFYTNKNLIHNIVKIAKRYSQKPGVKPPNLIAEWTRYIVAPAQITIYKVMGEKVVENRLDKKWYVLDGSFMNDLTDTWSIHQKWHVVPVNCLNTRKFENVWLAGSSCDSDDRYTAGGSYILLPRLEDCGELYVAIFDTGAYQDSLASHHCLLSSPAKLIALNGEVKVTKRRETPEEIGKLFGW